jgi:hypothetical protein
MSLYTVLEGLFVNTVSARGSEENNHQELGAKFPTTPVPIYRRVIVIDGTNIEWGENFKVLSSVVFFTFCFVVVEVEEIAAVVVEVVVVEEERVVLQRGHILSPCSLDISAANQRYFSLRTNQPPATSQQYFSLRTKPSASS